MTEEQKQSLINTSNELIEAMRPFVELMTRVWDGIKELVLKAYEELKKFLYKEIPIRAKCYRKGKKYIHGYKKVKMWRILCSKYQN